jgi:hypothetical protein
MELSGQRSIASILLTAFELLLRRRRSYLHANFSHHKTTKSTFITTDLEFESIVVFIPILPIPLTCTVEMPKSTVTVPVTVSNIMDWTRWNYYCAHNRI